LLGGASLARMTLSWTIQSPTMAGIEKQLAQAQALGYDSFNVKLGPPQTPEYDLEIVRKVCAWAPGGVHWADANTMYDLDTALAQAPKLADAGLRALESPLPPNRIRAYQRLKRQGALPILMDEGIIAPEETAEFIALGMMDGVVMKVARCGGLWNAHRIVRLLQENGLVIMASGLCDPDLSLAASIHLFAWANVTTPLGLNGPEYIAGRGTTDPAFRATGNTIPVPAAPGLGITLDRRVEQVLRVVA
jgi:muconate cycloisomerase